MTSSDDTSSIRRRARPCGARSVSTSRAPRWAGPARRHRLRAASTAASRPGSSTGARPHSTKRASIAATSSLAWVPGAFETTPARPSLRRRGPRPVRRGDHARRGDSRRHGPLRGRRGRVRPWRPRRAAAALGVPVVFGVLTTNTVEQALERSLPDETNKGREAALTALEMVSCSVKARWRVRRDRRSHRGL